MRRINQLITHFIKILVISFAYRKIKSDFHKFNELKGVMVNYVRREVEDSIFPLHLGIKVLQNQSAPQAFAVKIVMKYLWFAIYAESFKAFLN